MITLTGIASRRASRAPMQKLDSALISLESGVQGDFRGKPGKRQVTILSHECWQQACADTGIELDWSTRRANLLIKGIRFGPGHVGKILGIGEVRLQITRETDPCKRMDEAQPGLKNALQADWRGGVCCRVLHGGTVTVGDRITIDA